MNRPSAPLHPPTGPKASARPRHAHPLLSAFPLAVTMLGALLVLFALMMRLIADADGALRPSASTSLLARSPATSVVPVHMRDAQLTPRQASPLRARARS